MHSLCTVVLGLLEEQPPAQPLPSMWVSVISKLPQLRSLSSWAGERALTALFLICVPQGVSRSTDALDADSAEMSLAPNISFMLSTGGYRSHQVLAVLSSFVTDVHVSWQRSVGEVGQPYISSNLALNRRQRTGVISMPGWRCNRKAI